MGLKFGSHRRDLPGSPDVAFVDERVAVFCDGDFWHGRNWPSRKRLLARGSNGEYWVSKIQSNRRRDANVSRELKRSGWIVLRLWETDLAGDPEFAIGRVLAALSQGQRASGRR